MSLGWKIATWTTLVITILGTLGNIGKDDFLTVLVFGILIVGVCIKTLELAKEVENLRAKNKRLNKDTSVTLN
jgi:hypothetical protein